MKTEFYSGYWYKHLESSLSFQSNHFVNYLLQRNKHILKNEYFDVESFIIRLHCSNTVSDEYSPQLNRTAETKQRNTTIKHYPGRTNN